MNRISKKIHNVIRRAVLDKILAATSVREMVRIFVEFENVLVKKVEDDPSLYGWIEGTRPPRKF